MALIPVDIPVAQVPASIGSPTPLNLPSSGGTINNADIVVLNGTGQILEAGANPVGSIAGIVQHAGGAVFSGSATSLTSSLGYFQSTPLITLSTQEIIVVPLGAPVTVEISLTATTGWQTGGAQQAFIGTRVGLAVDGVTGYYLADPTASNKVATIAGKPFGPNVTFTGTGTPTNSKGNPGDLGARVYIAFDATALAIQQGH